MAVKMNPPAAPIASQIKKNRPMKIMLRRVLLAIWLYTSRILRHRRYSAPQQPGVARAVTRLRRGPDHGRRHPANRPRKLRGEAERRVAVGHQHVGVGDHPV